jgi:hypothetical protein
VNNKRSIIKLTSSSLTQQSSQVDKTLKLAHLQNKEVTAEKSNEKKAKRKNANQKKRKQKNQLIKEQQTQEATWDLQAKSCGERKKPGNSTQLFAKRTNFRNLLKSSSLKTTKNNKFSFKSVVEKVVTKIVNMPKLVKISTKK